MCMYRYIIKKGARVDPQLLASHDCQRVSFGSRAEEKAGEDPFITYYPDAGLRL